MLSPLQERVATVLADLPEARDFALAGGAALIVQGVVDRMTHDLDFFATKAEAVDALLPALEQALTEAGMTVERIQVNAGFARSGTGPARTDARDRGARDEQGRWRAGGGISIGRVRAARAQASSGSVEEASPARCSRAFESSRPLEAVEAAA